MNIRMLDISCVRACALFLRSSHSVGFESDIACTYSVYWVSGFYAMTLLYIYSSSTQLICIFPSHIHHSNEMRRFFLPVSQTAILFLHMWWIQHLLHATNSNAPLKSCAFIFYFCKMCPKEKNMLGSARLNFECKKNFLFEKIDKAIATIQNS